MTRYAWPPDREFWTGHFPEQTTARTTPYLFKGIVPAAAASPDHVLDGFAALRRAHAASTTIGAKARIYVGEDRRDDLLPRVLDAPAWSEGGFTAWMRSLTGADRFSLVVNNLETLSPPLAAGLGRFLGALTDGWGLPLGGAEQVAFAGNYAGTAFGIHEGYEDAFLIHLGPGAKNFYTWPAELYEKLTGGKEPAYGDYQNLLEHGEHFLLEPGDALFLPRRVFHVGTQDTFSVSVAIPLYTYPYARILESRVIPDVLAGLTGGGPDYPLSEPSAMAEAAAGPGAVADRLAAAGRELLHTATGRITSAAREHAEQRWATLRSNGGWELVEDDHARTEAANAFDPHRVTPGAAVTLIAPYRLTTLPATSGGGEEVLLRGYRTGVTVDAAALERDTVTALNTGAALTLPDEQALLTAVRALGATGGLRLTPPLRRPGGQHTVNPDNSLVQAYLKANPETRIALARTLQGSLTDGTVLVDKHLKPMIDTVYRQITSLVAPDKLTPAQARMYLEETSVFARCNAAYLRQASRSVEGHCPALAHELYRNFLEEGGEPGKVPAHYVLYSTALLTDLDLMVTGHVPAPETQTLLLLHERMVNSHQPSAIAGGYYATEGVAIAETELLRDITDRYGQTTAGRSGAELPKLDYYYRLHLDDGHAAAQVDGLSVEAAHIEGLADFLRKSDIFHLDLPQALTGFLEILEGMTHWWAQLAHRASEMN